MSTTSSPLSFTDRDGRPIPFYDDGFDGDQIYAFRESAGLTGIVRADSWEAAHSVCEDEFYTEADEATWAEMAKECDVPVTGNDEIDHEALMNSPIWQENYGFRPNGPNATDKHKHGIYQKDLNGLSLDRLTMSMLNAWGITTWTPGIDT